jgi:HAD superfamily hydrolase (TIGR01509 family)
MEGSSTAKDSRGTVPEEGRTEDVDLVIFDNDGVLVDTELAANRVLAELLTSYGLPTSVDDSIQRFLGTSLPYVRTVSENLLGGPLPNSFEAAYHEGLFGVLENGLEPIPGVGRVLRKLQLPFCVASSGSVERIERTLRMAGLWFLFSGRAFSAETVGRSKPAPDLFLHAAQVVGVEPGRCVVVEDSPWGIQAANAAGMTSLGFSYRTPAERLSEATGGIFFSMEELPGILGMPGDELDE